MGMWTIPLIIVIILISIFSYLSTVHVAKETERRAQTNDTPIPEAIKNYPTALNPIIWVYVVVGLFFVIFIFYYWAKYRY